MFTIQANPDGSIRYNLTGLTYEQLQDVKNALVANWWNNNSDFSEELLDRLEYIGL